ncbi:MAG: SH3 domain-containing protein, partial [Candidatus Ventricola sp.]
QTDYVQVALGELRGYIPKDDIRVLTLDGEKASAKIPQRATTLRESVMKNSPQENTKDGTPIAEGEKVYVLGKFGEWAFVQAAAKAGLDVTGAAPDNTGFVRLEDLSAPAGSTHLTAFVNTDKVNLRSRASSTEGQIIGKARTGQRLRVADYGKNWSIVVTPEGKRGYIMTKYLDFE